MAAIFYYSRKGNYFVACCLQSSTDARMPETSKQVSSRMPKLMAAVKPINDQINGISQVHTAIFLADHNNKPKVKMVVGQGNPKPGAAG